MVSESPSDCTASCQNYFIFHGLFLHLLPDFMLEYPRIGNYNPECGGGMLILVIPIVAHPLSLHFGVPH